jgi:hypothetical protein
MTLKKSLLVFSIYFLAASVVFATPNFPTGPDETITPGALCTNPNEHRYPEKISYCDRNVNSDEKWAVISIYEKKFNFIIDNTNRTEFKIDHYIPLCMGGANSMQNLWPQHQAVYHISDPLEVVLCQKLAIGKITQNFAIEKIKQGKRNYLAIPALLLELDKIK